ncbi:MAG TPA: crosslink repair DNA glycosylase YcaQ family protein [Methylomirabilota bacterium]|nr:crosslink repair DNA glycosylase YcaQ family protein [Methylomirabilota bacterium]
MIETLSASEARRLALAAQGFADARPGTRPGWRQMRRTLERLGLLQIDSVNVLVRAHYLPLFSRLGPYDTTALNRAAYSGVRRTVFEYWGHEASLMPVGLHPLFRWRMQRAERGVGIYGGLTRWARRRRPYIDEILAEVAERGPLSASELRNGGKSRGSWWGWSEGKAALEWLFWAGRVTTATRRGFERVYDLPERTLPPAVLAAPTPPEDGAHRALLLRAARALAVATERDLADYFRLGVVDVRRRLAELVEAGALLPARVEGWAQPAFLHPAARAPRRVNARALLSPFDSLVFERQRTERIFGFHYRLSIYTPAPLRAYGYYVLPFLLGDRLVARVDLKADREARVLRVLAAHAEPEVSPRRVAGALRQELADMAAWLALDRVVVSQRGELARALRARSGRS